VHHLDRRVGDGERRRRSVEHRDVAEPACATTGDGCEIGVRLDPGDGASCVGEEREVEAGAAADVEDVTTSPWGQ
jgi:hypothetical protein